MSTLTQKKLKELLHYDAETGVFTWKVFRGGGAAKVGDAAGWETDLGYKKICLFRKHYAAHRLAWLYMTGKWPTDEIDHKNGIRDDNRFCNLRESDRATNMQNQCRAQASNKSSGVLGAYKWGNKYIAKINARNKVYYLGLFDTAELANDAYMQAKRRLHPECVR